MNIYNNISEPAKRTYRSKNGIFVLTVILFWVCTVMSHQAYAASDHGVASNYADTIMVSKDGHGDFRSIQKAIEAAKSYPDHPIVIFIKKGIYDEVVRIPAWNPHLRLIGEDRKETIIRFNRYFGQVNKGRNSTFYTATLRVEAEDVSLAHLTIENVAGPVGQAIAVYVGADKCRIEDCSIHGHQDTFFATGTHTRVYLYHCQIEGTTDFLFGDATVYLNQCHLVCKANSYIVAASTVKEQPYGFVLDKCLITAAPGVKQVFLGRPWRPYARTVYLNCQMGAFIRPEGWDNWRNKANEKTAFYGEYNSRNQQTGQAMNVSDRVGWAHILNKQEAGGYTPGKVLGEWVLQP